MKRALLLLALAIAAPAAAARDTLVIQHGAEIRTWSGSMTQVLTFGASGTIEIVGVERARSADKNLAHAFHDQTDGDLPTGTWTAIVHTAAAGTEYLGGTCLGSVDYHTGAGNNHYVVLECTP